MKKILLAAIIVLLLAMNVNSLPDTIQCYEVPFFGDIVCSDNNVFYNINQAEAYYSSFNPPYEQVAPPYTFVTGGQTESFSGQ